MPGIFLSVFPAALVATIVAAVVAVSDADAAVLFTYGNEHGVIDDTAPWVLEGEIEKGDLDKLRTSIVQTGIIPGSIMLDSPGGDINEALNIGLFLQQNNVQYRSYRNAEGRIAPAECSSACALIFFATVNRLTSENSKTRIGLHRPFFVSAYRAQLNEDQAAAQYRRAETTLRAYLDDFRVPPEVVDIMFSTEPTQTRYFSDHGLARWVLDAS